MGPKVFIKQACENFIGKYGRENCYIQDDYLVHTQEREFTVASDLIRHIFTREHIGMIKVGKNLKNTLISTHEFIDIGDLADNPDFLMFLDDFLNPAQHISRC